MPTTITFIFDNPTDPTTFEDTFTTTGFLDKARALPTLERLESARVWPKDDGGPTPAYRLITLHFPDYAAACAAVRTTEAAGLFPLVQQLATGGVRIVFADIEES